MNYRITYNNGTAQVEQKVQKSFLGFSYEGWETTTSQKLEDAAQAFQTHLEPRKFDTWRHTEYAFTWKGKDYYHFPDASNIGPVRYGYAMLYMKESSMNCDKDFLLAYIKAVETALNPKTGSINLIDIASLSKDMRDRLDYAFIPDLIYKWASVAYFDKTEDPNGYDYDYNQKKIAEWKEGGAAFFLETPVGNLTGSDLTSIANLPAFMKMLDNLDKQSTKSVLEKVSPSLNKQELKEFSSLLYRAGLQ